MPNRTKSKYASQPKEVEYYAPHNMKGKVGNKHASQIVRKPIHRASNLAIVTCESLQWMELEHISACHKD